MLVVLPGKGVEPPTMEGQSGGEDTELSHIASRLVHCQKTPGKEVLYVRATSVEEEENA